MTDFPGRILFEVIKNFYTLSHNICKVKEIFGINAHIWIFLAIFCITACFNFIVYIKNKTHKKNFSFRNTILFKISVTAFVIIAVIQLLNRNITQKWSDLSKYPLDQKYHAILGPTYDYIKFCLNKSTKKGTGKLITDLDIYQTSKPHVLGYFLYPKINILYGDIDSEDYLIVYEKKDSLVAIEKHFQLIGTFNSKNLIAQKDPKLK